MSEKNFNMAGLGNFVATLSRATYTKGSEAIKLCQADIFRINNGEVVEHWENREPVTENNVNGGKC